MKEGERMSEKRFTTKNGVFYTDNLTGWEFQSYGEVVKLMNELADENEQLKEEIKDYNDVLARLEEKLQRERKSTQQQHQKWSTQAEQQIQQLKDIIDQLRTDNTKQKKLLNKTMKQNKHTTTTIKTMMENERTELGRSVLRQLWEAIQ